MPVALGPFRRALLQTLCRLRFIFPARQPNAVGHTVHMGVHGNHIGTKGKTHHDICAFATNARQAKKAVARVGHHTIVLAQKRGAKLGDVARLHVVKPGRFDRLGDVFRV